MVNSVKAGLALRLVFLWRRISYSIRFLGRPIRVHPSSWISWRSVLKARNGHGSITIGANCAIHPFSMLLTYGGHIHIGNDCSVNPFTIVYGHGGTKLGDGVRIAAHSVIIPANHTPASDGQSVHLAPVSARGIEIANNVWLGAGSRILDGVHIGRNSVVGAGSVVTKSVPEDSTVAGVPARVIKQR